MPVPTRTMCCGVPRLTRCTIKWVHDANSQSISRTAVRQRSKITDMRGSPECDTMPLDQGMFLVIRRAHREGVGKSAAGSLRLAHLPWSYVAQMPTIHIVQ